MLPYILVGNSRPLFLYFRLFNTTTGFEPRTSRFGSDHSANWATTTALSLPNLLWIPIGGSSCCTIYSIKYVKHFIFIKCHPIHTCWNLPIGKPHQMLSVNSVTSKKLPNVYKSCPKMISLEKLKILTSSQKLPKNMGDLGKLIVAKGFETTKVQ